MIPALQLIADGQLGVVTGRDAVRAGLSPEDIRSLLRRREWTRLRRGVYIETDRARVLQSESRSRHLLDCVAVLVTLDEGPVLSHSSAARLHEVLVPSSVDDRVRLTDESQWRTGRGYRVARATVPARVLLPFHRFRATSPARTLVDCAREWPLEEAVVAIDEAIQRRCVTRAQLGTAVHAARHWVGVGSAARAVSLADGRAESPLETRGRLRILASGLPAPEIQVELHTPAGRLARVDAWYDEAAVAIEFDGRVKYTDPYRGRTPAQVLWEEKRREDRIRDLGVRFVRLADEDVDRRWPAAVARLRDLLAAPHTGVRPFVVIPTVEPGAASAVA